MTRARPAIVALVVALIGSWGCARSTTNHTSAHADRVKTLETKNAKLEDDFRAAAATRDQLRKKLAEVETQLVQLRTETEEQVRTLTRERDELRREVASRTAERDAMANQYELFRKNIRELLGQAEAAIPRPVDHPPVTTADTVIVPGKS